MIHLSSKLVDATRTATPGGSRYAIADGGMSELPPNEEALLGLNSVNSYDSLSSRQYQELMSRWSVSPNHTYGRFFRSLEVRAALADQAFPLSNVSVILSRLPLPGDGMVLINEVAGIKLYRPTALPVSLRQTSHFRLSDADHCIMEISPESPELAARNVETLNDFQKIQVTASAHETLLFVSQQYHCAWRATSHRRSLRAVSVNGFYQGIILPPFTDEIELWFRPFVLWSWIPQLLFVGVGASLLVHRLWRIRRDDGCVAG